MAGDDRKARIVKVPEALKKDLNALPAFLSIETVDCHELDPELDRIVINALADVQSSWRMIGVYLKLKGRLLDVIERRCRSDTTRCLEEMVRAWLTLSYPVEKYGRPTWQFVIMAAAKGSGNYRYAEELATRFRHPWDSSKYLPIVSSLLGDPETISNATIDESVTVEITEQLKEGLAGRWVHFGLALGLTHDALEDICDAMSTSHDSFQRVLDAGVEGRTLSKKAITWRMLSIAVDARNGGNNPLLAKTIADKHRDPTYTDKRPSPIPSPPSSSWASSEQQHRGKNNSPVDDTSSPAEDTSSPADDTSSPSEDTMLQDAIYWQPHFGEDISSEVDGVLREKLTPGLQYLAEKLRLKVETDPKKLRQIVAKQAAHSKRPGKMSRKTIPDPPEMAAEFAHYPVVSILDNPPRSRGFALIFSITRFADPSIKPRVGGNIDADNLEKTFTQLGYDVLVYRDDQCTAMGIEVIFENIKRMYCMASKYPPQHDSFICCISSHGVKETGEEFIVPYDYNVADVQPRVHLAKLSHMINAHNCPVLAAKPKLFFIQACRGVELPGMVRANVADSNTETDDTEEIHEDSDFLFSYSTRVSNKSVRDKLAGSWYIQELCQLLQSDAAKRKDICTLITEVHRRVVANHKDHFQGTWFRQCPEVTHTLRLLFYFYKQEF